jgi:VWFA-related protein
MSGVSMKAAGVALVPLMWAGGQSGVTIRTTTTLVQVGVIARDAKGQRVEGLTKGDFEILDNGMAQSIAMFYGESGAAEAMPKAQLPPGMFTNRLAENPANRAGHSSVILLDWANTGFRNTARARETAREVVNRLAPDERMGIYSFDRFGLKVVDEIGSQRAAMLEKLKTLIGQKSPCFQKQLDGLDDKYDDNMGSCGGPTVLAQNVKAFYVGQRTRDTLLAFESIAAHLTGVPGRKALIWISSAFPLEIDQKPDGNGTFPNAIGAAQLYSTDVGRAMTKLNNADVALYPVDARGLGSGSADFGTADDNTWPTMDYFAQRTGGIAYHGNNGLNVGIQAAIEDVQTSYTLGFYAPLDGSRAGFHKLTVRSLRPGVKLRYKEGYYVDTPGKISKDDRKEAVRGALTGLVDATAVPITVQASRQKNTLKLRVSLRPNTLGLTLKGGRWQGRVEFITRFAKQDGSECATPVSRRIEFNLSERSYDAGQNGGLLFSRALDIPAKAARLRVLVRNEPSGEIGTLTIPIGEVGQ